MRYFCVTHKVLGSHVPQFMRGVSNTSEISPHIVDVTEDFAHLAAEQGDPLSEYATLFGLCRRLAQDDGDPDEMVGISQYRRFLVIKDVPGTLSPPYLVLPGRLLEQLDSSYFLPPAGVLAAPAALRLGMPVLHQYALSHVVRDLLYFMAIAVDQGVVEDRRVSEFLSGDVLTAVPSIGVFPRSWLISTMSQLESVSTLFKASVYVPRDGYQRRVLGFCLERLHSLLLMQLIAQWPKGKLMTRPIVMVSEDGTVTPGG